MIKYIITNNFKLLSMFLGYSFMFVIGFVTGNYIMDKKYQDKELPYYWNENAELRIKVTTLLDLVDRQEAQLKEYRDAALKEEGQPK